MDIGDSLTFSMKHFFKSSISNNKYDFFVLDMVLVLNFVSNQLLVVESKKSSNWLDLFTFSF